MNERKSCRRGGIAGSCLFGPIATVQYVMSTISVHDIQRDPQAFVGRVEAGESLVVVRGERPLPRFGR